MDLDALHAELAPAPAAHRAHLLGLARRAAAAPAGSALQAWLAQRLTALRQAPVAVPAMPTPAERVSPLVALRAALPQRPAGAEPLVLQTDRRTWTRLRLQHRLHAPAAPAPDAPQLGPLHAQVLVPAALTELASLSPEYLARMLAQWDQLQLLSTEPAAAPKTSSLKGPAKGRAGGKTGRATAR